MVEHQKKSETYLANAQNPLAALLFDRSVGWDECIGKDFLHAQLSIKRLSCSGALVLEWTSTAALRPDAANPMKIQFVIPDDVIAATTPSAFKSQLVTDFISSNAANELEPLRSPFYQALREQGYAVRAITNAQIAFGLMKTFDSTVAFLSNCQLT